MTDDIRTAVDALADHQRRTREIALHAAVIADHNLPAALAMAPPPDLDTDGDFHTAATADYVNESTRAVETATVARIMRMASAFCEFIRTGMTPEEHAEAELLLADHLGIDPFGGEPGITP
jgi:hypothetical protein